MSEPDLENRLRQHARRTGLMIGLSMVLTIAICIGSATLIYAALVPMLSDLVPIQLPAASQPNPVPQNPATDGVSAASEPTAAVAAPAVATEAAPTVAPATPTANAFKPDYQIKAAESVNFRAGPSTGDQILQALPPATPLQYLNEDAPVTNPNDGPRWMKFRIEDGTVGWVRQIDTDSYKP